MRIAFTSCFDAEAGGTQAVWAAIKAQSPDVLLLLGDNIYTDFNWNFNKVWSWPLARFAAELHRRYAAQWQVATWRELLTAVEVVAAIWDDHDYAWNGAFGGEGTHWLRVSKERHRISRALFRQFTAALNERPAAYPSMPSLDALKAGPDGGIEHAFVHHGVQFLMVDGRSHREQQQHAKKEIRASTLLGLAQREWLLQRVTEHTGLTLLCSGSTLRKADDAWDAFGDFDWLRAHWPAGRNCVLSGDIHKNRHQVHPLASGKLHEFTASGAARPDFDVLGPIKVKGASGNFGLLEVLADGVRCTWHGQAVPSVFVPM